MAIPRRNRKNQRFTGLCSRRSEALCRLGLLLGLFLVLILPGIALSHPLDMYGFGARAVGMGGAYSAVADDYSALFYNIGGLVQIDKNEATAGFMWAKPLFSLELEPADGTSRAKAKELHELEKDQVDVDDVNGYFFGFALKPHRLFAIGLGAYLPQGLVVRLNPLDSTIPTFFMHEHRSQRVVTMFGASIRVLPSLSVGGGVRLFLKAKGHFSLPLNATSDNLVLSTQQQAEQPMANDADLKLDFPLTTYPFFGLHYKPTENLRFGLSYQYLYKLDVDLDVDVDLVLSNYTVKLQELSKIAPGLFPLKTVIELNIPELGDTPLRVPVELDGLEGELTVNAAIPLAGMISISDLWKPQSVTAGVAYDPVDALTLSFDAVYYNWAAFPSPDMKVSIDNVSINLETLPTTIQGRIKSLAIPVLGTIGPLPPVSIAVPGLDVQLEIPVELEDVTSVSTRDIIVPRLGFEYRFPTVQSFWWTGDLDVAVRGGYTYSPTPFKADKGKVNIIDSDTHTISSGLGLAFNDFFSLDFYGQYQYFVPVEVEKDYIDADLPFKSYKAAGHIFGGGLSAGVKW